VAAPRLRITRREFRRLVAQAVAGLPPQVAAALENVDILVQEWPSAQQLASGEPGNRYSLLGLYEGIPRTERTSTYNLVLPDRITLFQRPLEAACASREELQEEVQATVVHEIAHHLGWSDDDLERLGYA
jgi:predicted Zn-dependent protease with MMP-like domain